MTAWFWKIWKDSVWSKVISSGLFAAIAYLFTTTRFGWWKEDVSVGIWVLASLAVVLVLSLIAIVGLAFKLARPVNGIVGLPPNIILMKTTDSLDPKAHYPLKRFAHFTNNSSKSVDVRVSKYERRTVETKRFETGVIQVMMDGRWMPPDISVKRLAVLSGQEFRAWVAFDEKVFNLDQLKTIGTVGKLFLRVDDTDLSFTI